MNKLTVTWRGIRPLIMHNGDMADRNHPGVQRIKEITAKGSKKMTDADFALRDQIEWESGLYWSDELGCLAIPSNNVEACLVAGARKSRLGNDFKAAVWCARDQHPLIYDGPKTKAELYATPAFVLRQGVRVNKARIIRIRPMIPTGWKIKVELEYDPTITNEKQILNAMNDSGALVGLGDYRPKFGRFLVE